MGGFNDWPIPSVKPKKTAEKAGDGIDGIGAGHRIQFEFPPKAYERLQRIKALTGSTSYAELFRRALRVYEWVKEQEKAGNKIGVITGDQTVREVKFLF